ncbi:MAG: LLM class flavin-dependent oxidoreductase [Anaerolineae bacterium]|nr:LLM class flavin-dependent oxidoreductase [Anaerolineae bacterium]
MKFSIRLNNDLPPHEYIELAQEAERWGFDQFWVSDDLFLRSAMVILTAVAQATKRIEIGSCILNPYTLNPAQIAMEVATLDELSGYRFNLGISSGAGEFLKWIGISQEKPRTALIESITAIRKLLSGERAATSGSFLKWTDEAYMRFTPRRVPPIYIGAMSPNMLRTIGELADGGLPLLFPPEHYDTVQPYIAEGAAKADRSLDEIDIAACIWCSVAEDKAAAEDVLKEKVAYYGHAMSDLIWSRLGLTAEDFRAIEVAVMAENNLEKAKTLVTPQMLQVGVSGSPKDLIRRLEGLVDRGVKHISFGPPLGPDPLLAIRTIGGQVLPYFRG